MNKFFKKYWKTIIFLGTIWIVTAYEILNWRFGWNAIITEHLSSFSWWLALVVGIAVAFIDPITPLAMALAIGIFHVLGVSTWWLLIPTFAGGCFTVWLGTKISKKANPTKATATVGWVSFVILAIMDFEIILIIICAKYLNNKIIWLGGLLGFAISILTLWLPAATTVPGSGFPMIVFAYILSFTVTTVSLFIKPLRQLLNGELAPKNAEMPKSSNA
jgi:hypothetical protein